MTQAQLARREFLKLSLVTAGAVMLTGCQKVIDIDSATSSLRATINPSKKINEILRFATLAANGHNTQPWQFRVQDTTIEIHPDTSRRLSVVDPHDREHWISLGCALENLVIAAGASGYASEVIYPDEKRKFIIVELKSDAIINNVLFDAIPVRQSTRSEYSGEVVPPDLLTQVHATVTESGVELLFIEGKNEIETALEYVNEGNLKQYADEAFLEELIQWLRFNKKEAVSSMDGLYSKCSGNPTVPRWLGEMFVSGTKPAKPG